MQVTEQNKPIFENNDNLKNNITQLVDLRAVNIALRKFSVSF